LTEISSAAECAECVDLYVAQKWVPAGFLPYDYSKAFKYLFDAVRRGRFACCVKLEGKIVAWMLAEVGLFPHADYKVLQQKYYCSSLTGMAAARAVKILHEAAVERAIRDEIPYVTSTASPLDSKLSLPKLLEKFGWERYSYMAIKRVAEQPRLRKTRESGGYLDEISGQR